MIDDKMDEMEQRAVGMLANALERIQHERMGAGEPPELALDRAEAELADALVAIVKMRRSNP